MGEFISSGHLSPRNSVVRNSATGLAHKMTRRGMLARVGAAAVGVVASSALDLGFSQPAYGHIGGCNNKCGPSDYCNGNECAIDGNGACPDLANGCCSGFLPMRGPYGESAGNCFSYFATNAWNVCFCGSCSTGGKYRCGDCCGSYTHNSGFCTGSVYGMSCTALYRCICKSKISGCPASCPECTWNGQDKHTDGTC
jgi:hypothetical protein